MWAEVKTGFVDNTRYYCARLKCKKCGSIYKWGGWHLGEGFAIKAAWKMYFSKNKSAPTYLQPVSMLVLVLVLVLAITH